MKIRSGFVSNSSSSSYTCDICNVTESGWDLCLSDAEMNECVASHTFCEKHAPKWELTWKDKKELALNSYHVKGKSSLYSAIAATLTEMEFDGVVEEHDLEWIWEDVDSGYGVPSRGCPICSFGKVHERDAVLYLLKVAGRTEADLLEELKERFASYEEMKKWLA